MKYREVARKLASLGVKRSNAEALGSLRKWVNPTVQRGAVVPDWGPRDLKMGTARGVVRQMGIDWQDFQRA